jgi:pimeloyl-[acyl-carrier protein] synthase
MCKDDRRWTIDDGKQIANRRSSIVICIMNRFNPLDPAVVANPYPAYSALRASEPVHWGVSGDVSWPGTWYLFAHNDVVPALKDPRLGREIEPLLPAVRRPTRDPKFAVLQDMLQEWMLLRDPPQHTHLRTPVIRAFTPRVVEKMVPRARQLAAELVTKQLADGKMELIKDFARTLPVMIIAEMLGVPPHDHPKFSPYAVTLAAAIEFEQTDAMRKRGVQALAALREYVDWLFVERRRVPQDDLISALLHANDERVLSDAELFGVVTILMVAGNDPTMHMIGNAMHTLLQQPERLAELQQQPEKIDDAVDELLRFDSSVQMTFRYALQDVEIHGQSIKTGDHIALVFGAALRDAAYCEAPDELRFERSNNWLPFGGGIHFCLGNMLARMIGQESLRVLCQLPNLKLAVDPSTLQWQNTVAVRGLTSLPVTFERS